jgi:hypothetical protein
MIMIQTSCILDFRDSLRRSGSKDICRCSQGKHKPGKRQHKEGVAKHVGILDSLSAADIRQFLRL